MIIKHESFSRIFHLVGFADKICYSVPPRCSSEFGSIETVNSVFDYIIYFDSEKAFFLETQK